MTTRTKTMIANMALYHLGQSKRLTDVDADTGKPAEVLRDFYETVRDRMFRDFPWPFALRYSDIALLQDQPTGEWAYAYRYPNAAIRVWRILSDVWPETPETREPYRIISDNNGKVILANRQDAQLEYSIVVEDVNKWPPDFVEAFALLWASAAAASLTAGDQFKLGLKALQLYEISLQNAEFNAANEGTIPPMPAESSYITARD